MKTPLILSIGTLALLGGLAIADKDHDRDHRERGEHGERHGRPTGTVTMPRYYHNEHSHRYERHGQVYEYRSPGVIARDPYAHAWQHGYRPHHDWEHFHAGRGGWFSLWGIPSWNVVSTVTCEAANEQTGELYPVTATNVGGWNDAQVNSVLDQALDECAAEAGDQVCAPATPSCSYQ